MTQTPVGASVSWGEVCKDGFSYNSILYAIQRLILMLTPRLPRSYLPNFEGITRALYDLGTLLEAGGGGGVFTPQPGSSVGATPPGWDTATGTYIPGKEPVDGTLWYDTRQGRLFVCEALQWYQTNGAEAMLLDELIDVTSDGAINVITAANQVGMLVRDLSVADGQPGAWKKVDTIDDGLYP